MRGTRNTYYEYIPELHTEHENVQQDSIRIFDQVDRKQVSVGCDVVAHVIRAGVLSDTHRDK